MKKQICENCRKGIDVPETALKLCDDCFDEKCVCGHKRALHVNNKFGCINQKGWRSNYAFCKCKKFKKRK